MEAIYEIRLITGADHLGEARELLTSQLNAANYPLHDVRVVRRNSNTIELVARLLSTAVEPAELDNVVSALEKSTLTQDANWSTRTAE